MYSWEDDAFNEYIEHLLPEDICSLPEPEPIKPIPLRPEEWIDTYLFIDNLKGG
jgi:hypothetical protein